MIQLLVFLLSCSLSSPLLSLLLPLPLSLSPLPSFSLSLSPSPPPSTISITSPSHHIHSGLGSSVSIMDIIPACAITAGGIIFLLLLNRLHPCVVRFVGYLSVLVSKHLTYPYLLRRHRFFGPWSRSGVALQIIFISINLFCISFVVSMFPVSIRWSKTAEAGSRAGTLALITLIPLLAGAHHALLADLLGVSLQTIRLIHRSAGVAVPLLCLLHVLFALTSKVSFSLDNTQDVFAVIVGIDPRAKSEN